MQSCMVVIFTGSFLRLQQQPLMSVSEVRSNWRDENLPHRLNARLILTCPTHRSGANRPGVLQEAIKKQNKHRQRWFSWSTLWLRKDQRNMFRREPPAASEGVKYLLISTLTGSGSTSSISRRLVQCMRESALSARGPYQQNQGDDRQAEPTKARLWRCLEGR